MSKSRPLPYDCFLTEKLAVKLTLAFWYPNKNVVFGILKASHFQYDAFWGEGRCRTKILAFKNSHTNITCSQGCSLRLIEKGRKEGKREGGKGKGKEGRGKRRKGGEKGRTEGTLHKGVKEGTKERIKEMTKEGRKERKGGEGRREEEKKERKKERRKEGRKEGRKDRV
jgi:hypothetical protein